MPAADLTFSQAVYEGGPTVTARAIANAGASPPKLPARVVLPDIDYNACQLQGTEPFWVNNQLKGAIVLLPGVKEVASNNPGCWSEQNGVPLAWDAARQGAAALVILDAVDITNAHEIYTGGEGTSLSDMNIQVGTVGGARVGGKDVGGFPAVRGVAGLAGKRRCWALVRRKLCGTLLTRVQVFMLDGATTGSALAKAASADLPLQLKEIGARRVTPMASGKRPTVTSSWGPGMRFEMKPDLAVSNHGVWGVGGQFAWHVCLCFCEMLISAQLQAGQAHDRFLLLLASHTARPTRETPGSRRCDLDVCRRQRLRNSRWDPRILVLRRRCPGGLRRPRARAWASTGALRGRTEGRTTGV